MEEEKRSALISGSVSDSCWSSRDGQEGKLTLE